MPVSELHRRVAAVALSAAARHGFALGGGNALLAYGIISRETQDVDLFTDQERGVEAAAGAVEAALREASFMTERRDLAGGLADVFPGMGEGLAEWIVTAPNGGQMMLQMAYFDRDRDPVVTDIGPVLDVQDVAGGKVCALAGRVEPRDYADTAAILEHYSPAQLIGLSQEDITAVRGRFASWPRTAAAAESELGAGSPPLRSPSQRNVSSDREASHGDSISHGRPHLEPDEPEIG
jgi:hypothetical protein